jgi:hypothetical protein
MVTCISPRVKVIGYPWIRCNHHLQHKRATDADLENFKQISTFQKKHFRPRPTQAGSKRIVTETLLAQGNFKAHFDI